MKIEVIHDFPCSPDRFFDVIESSELEAAIARLSTSRREPLEERWDASILVRRWRITPSRELPGVIRKLLGRQGLPYAQTSRVDRENRTIDWTIDVARSAGRAQIGGVLQVEPTETGCRRMMRSEIRIRVPLVGSRVESAIAKDVRRTYERSHRLVLGLLPEIP